MNKFKELVHYICFKCDGVSDLGATKLNKTAWYSDVFHYLSHGTPITSETYVKQQFGPVPKHILSVLDELVGKGKIEIIDTNFHGFKKKEYISLVEPDVSVFSAEEVSTIEDAIGFVCDGNTASSISAYSHDHVWKAASIGEEIPIYAMLVSEVGDVTAEDLAWAATVSA